MDYATISVNVIQLLVDVVPFETLSDNFFKVKDLVDRKDTMEFGIRKWIWWLGVLERYMGGGSSSVRDVGGLATVNEWRERAQEIYDKRQEIKGKYENCQGSGWWAVGWKPRVYLDGGELKKLEGEFEALVSEIKGMLILWMFMWVMAFGLSFLGGVGGGVVSPGRRIR